MAVDYNTLDIVFSGLDDKADPRVKRHGKLAEAINVEFDKQGRLNKRRGYIRVDTSAVLPVGTNAYDGMFHAVDTRRGELVVWGTGFIASVVSQTGDVSSTDAITMANRGATCRGNYRIIKLGASVATWGQEWEAGG